MLGQLVSEWMTTLTPGQFAVMPFKTAASNYTLQVTIEYEDEAGYRWQRTDSSQPRRVTDDGVPNDNSAQTRHTSYWRSRGAVRAASTTQTRGRQRAPDDRLRN